MLTLDSLIVDFGDPHKEALSCRQDCALFDFSFVCRARVSGPNAIRVIERFQPRRVRDMSVGQIRYSVKTNRRGRVRSDLTLWRFAQDSFEIMSGFRGDIDELLSLRGTGLVVDDLSQRTAIFAIQGRNTLTSLARYIDTGPLQELSYFHFIESSIDNLPCIIGRLGYSGEKGFEILIEQSSKTQLWDLLAERITPAGFAAIDILRIEAGFFLFTNECRIAPAINELGLSNLLAQDTDLAEIRFAAFTANSETDLTLWQPKSEIVERPASGAISVTSACYSPYFENVIGLGFVPADQDYDQVLDPGKEFLDIELCAIPLFDPDKNKPRQPW